MNTFYISDVNTTFNNKHSQIEAPQIQIVGLEKLIKVKWGHCKLDIRSVHTCLHIEHTPWSYCLKYKPMVSMIVI